MESNSVEKIKFIKDKVTYQLSNYIVPLLIVKYENSHRMDDILANGTGTLIKLGDKHLLITCHHVWKSFITMRNENKNISLFIFIGCKNCINISKITPIYNDTANDLTVLDLSFFVKDEKLGAKQFYHPSNWPPLRPNVNDLVIVLGYPGQLRQPEKECISILWIFDFIKAISEHDFTLRDENYERQTEYYDSSLSKLSDFGGCSGCPGFLIRDNNLDTLELVGIMYEGCVEICNENIGIIKMTHCDLISI